MAQERSNSDEMPSEGLPNDALKAQSSKIRLENLRIQPYNFFAYEQFGVTPNYTYKCDEISEGGRLWSWCYQSVWFDFDKIADELSRRPADTEVLERIGDAGHATFYIALCQAKKEGLLEEGKLQEALLFWSKYFSEWTPWFKDNYPKYFLA